MFLKNIDREEENALIMGHLYIFTMDVIIKGDPEWAKAM